MPNFYYTVTEETEDGNRGINTSYDTISDLIVELQENSVELPDMVYESEPEVYDAYQSLNLDPSEMEELEDLIRLADEAYRGNFSSWADFAQEEAEEIYNIPNHWPYTAIDWDDAGEQLSDDFEQHNHYFFYRNV